MSAANQHGFHPSAESLNAFAEQALSERERTEVLAHLAVCGRCRHVVALARKAADACAAAKAARPLKAAAPRRWRSWQVAWIPVAALAASAALTVYVHVRSTEHGDGEGRAEERNAARDAPCKPVA